MRSVPVIFTVLLALTERQATGHSGYLYNLKFAADLIKMFKIGQADVQFGFTVFSQSNRNLKDNTSPESLEREILKAPFFGSSTHTDKAIKLVLDSQMFSSKAGGRPDARNITIIMTDGISEKTSRNLECFCPSENQDRLWECQISVQRSNKRETAIWTAIDSCCNGTDLHGLAYGCAFINDKCKCPAFARSLLPWCELISGPTTFVGKEECCSGIIAQGRTYGCRYSDGS